MRLGIDFGTTRTVVAHVDRGNYPVVRFQDDGGDSVDWFPSVVAERNGELRFGFAALAVANDPSFTVVRSFKRAMSDPVLLQARSVRVGSSELLLGDLVRRYLGALLEALQTRSTVKDSLRRAKSIRTVVATPANAHGAQRFVTLDAFRRAGFDAVAMLNEPSAAGFEYTHRHRETITSRRDHVVVYDLGGGTFDASLVRMSGRHHDVLGTAGIAKLGGDDFDSVLADLALDAANVPRAAVPSPAYERLLDQCRDAKERLHPSSRKITIDLEAALEGDAPRGEITLSASDFYDACAPLVERTIDAMAPLMVRMDAESGAPLEPSLDDIAGVYVVGGASELPLVARALRQRFGRRVHRSPHPSAAIAIGLAIASDEASGFELADRFTRTFGVFREGAAGDEITFDAIFTRETRLPSRASANGAHEAHDANGAHNPTELTCRRSYRAAHNVGHYRFFECSAVGDDGKPRGDLALFGDVLFPFDASLEMRKETLREVKVERMGESGPRIEEEYALDENGIVRVTIRNLDAGYVREFRLGAGG